MVCSADTRGFLRRVRTLSGESATPMQTENNRIIWGDYHEKNQLDIAGRVHFCAARFRLRGARACQGGAGQRHRDHFI